jgi:hypothetical protein
VPDCFDHVTGTGFACVAQIKRASTLSEIELYAMAKEIAAPVDLLRETAKLRLRREDRLQRSVAGSFRPCNRIVENEGITFGTDHGV